MLWKKGEKKFMDMREVFAQRPVLAIMRNVPLEDTLYYAGPWWPVG